MLAGHCTHSVSPVTKGTQTSHTAVWDTALVEALMGFQFNHVGGGTKTRRPITLHMKYNSACVQPNCFLLTEDAGEQEVTLEELQARLRKRLTALRAIVLDVRPGRLLTPHSCLPVPVDIVWCFVCYNLPDAHQLERLHAAIVGKRSRTG